MQSHQRRLFTEYRQQPNKLAIGSGARKTTKIAEQLKLFVQMRKNTASSEAFTTFGCATGTSLANLSELEAMETDLNNENYAMIDVNLKHKHVMLDEEQFLCFMQHLMVML